MSTTQKYKNIMSNKKNKNPKKTKEKIKWIVTKPKILTKQKT